MAPAARLFALMALGLAQRLPAQQSADEDGPSAVTERWRPPTLTITRYTEDWSKLADPANRTGQWTEPFKYLPLDNDGRVSLTTGLEIRLRNENYDEFDWGGADVPDQGNVWLRALPYVDLHAGSFRAFVQPIANAAWGIAPAPSPVDRTGVDLLQAFVDYVIDARDGTEIRIEAGRQMVSLGRERLVGTRYGPNTPLAFDGSRIIVHHGSIAASLFYLLPVEPGSDSFDDRRSRSRALWGAYGTRWLGEDRHGRIDLYYLGLRDDHARYQQGSGREVRHTFGLRGSGRAKALHWDIELMGQIGSFAGAQIRAWSSAFQLGAAFAALPFKPDITVNFDIVSGDRDTARRGLQTFNPLFPKGKYFGELSPIGPRNIVDLHPTLTLDLGGNVALGLAGMAYWRQSAGDGVYDIPGHLLRAGAPGDGRFIGKQAEATLEWQATPELALSASASHFVPGPFLRNTGAHRPITMTALEANFRF